MGGGRPYLQRASAGVRLRGKLVRTRSIWAERKALNLDSFLRMLLFEGRRHVGEVLEFGAQVQPMIAADGGFEGRLNFSPFWQSGC